MAHRPIVQFTPFSSLIQPTFWHELTRLKLDVLKLSADDIPITAYYVPGRAVTDRETGKEVDLGCHLAFAGDAFDEKPQFPPGSIACKGILRNYNTLEEFKAADKTALLNHIADQIWAGITSSDFDPTDLTRFILITFADLKKYKYYYWLGVPALVARPAWNIAPPGWDSVNEKSASFSPPNLSSIQTQLSSDTHGLGSPSFFLCRPSPNGGTAELAPLSSSADFWANTPDEKRTVIFVDPSAAATHPGWPLRNVLAFLQARHKVRRIRVLCWRDTGPRPPADGHWRSRVGVVYVPEDEIVAETDVNARPTAVGWEKNPQGKLGPRLADLAPMMDPTRLADQAVDLNLKLMRWRILPALRLEVIADTKCLLLGAGTLGCYVARSLMAWGVRTITLVDSATVSFSNPVRQPLFEFDDCLAGGKPKAQCAADSLRRIFPGVNSTGVQLNIPMPGHPIPHGAEDAARKDVEQLERLIKDHDAVFLLMDSRESRWLPTVLGKAHGKIVMNAALGFDSYLVMRHGARVLEGEDAPKLGCYYCNDVVAPADSLTDRTLDQMCTVTRPGLAAIASATAVELLVSLLQHPAGVKAPAPPPDYDYKSQDADGDDVKDKTKDFRSVLGVIPHQLRGFLAQFRTLPIVGAAYDRCTACSENIIREYETHGFATLLRAFNETGYLERLTGLDKLQNDTELEAVDWVEEDEEDTEL